MGDGGKYRRTVGGKYRIHRQLGEGAYGAVFEAENTWTRRAVAVKILRPEFTDGHEAAQRFLREGRAAARHSHPHVVDILDMGEDPEDGALYIVMELLCGEDLRALLERRRKLRPAEALTLVAPIMEALAALHTRGIVHRDVKPSNVFVARDPHDTIVPKLIDFGMARLLEPGDPEFRTRTGQMVGTPRYMAPEQVRGDRGVDARADVWSVGVVLYELLAGVPPFDAPSVPEVLTQIRTGSPAPLSLASLGVTQALASAIHRALIVDRDQRYPTMEAFLAALRIAVTDVPTATTAPSVAEAGDYRTGASVAWRVLAVIGAVLIALTMTWARHFASTPSTFTVDVRVQPVDATLLLDGVATGHGVLHRVLVRDGHTHALLVSSAEHVSRTITFCDAPPPRIVALTPLRP